MSALFEIRHLSHRYSAGNPSLNGCSLRIEPGSRNALLGPNGSGKTTLLQLLNGLLRPSSGEIIFDGRTIDYSRRGLHTLRQRVGLVFQNPDQQLFSASVWEDVSFGPINLGLSPELTRLRVETALAAVGMADQADRPVHMLSFGQKKRVALAGVLAMEPEVLLLDEPMAGLDAEMHGGLLAILENLTRQGKTIVVSTHDVDFAYHWADQLHLLSAGNCSATLPASDLPSRLQDLQMAGQPVPTVLKLQAALAQRGISLKGPLPRCLDGLMAAIEGSAP